MQVVEGPNGLGSVLNLLIRPPTCELRKAIAMRWHLEVALVRVDWHELRWNSHLLQDLLLLSCNRLLLKIDADEAFNWQRVVVSEKRLRITNKSVLLLMMQF